jgi:hypothetical protein
MTDTDTANGIRQCINILMDVADGEGKSGDMFMADEEEFLNKMRVERKKLEEQNNKYLGL